MPKYSEPALRIACLLLAALLVWQVFALALRRDPLSGIRVPSAARAGEGRLSVRDGANSKERSTASTVSTNIPKEVKARIDRIADSEILGPVPRPAVVPLTLLGIAGQHAFLRTPDGQTSLCRLGEEIAGIKLLQIGTNRVLVQQDGQRKELTLFLGFGSEPLLPREKETPK